MRARVEMRIKLPIKLVKKAKWYVASCPALDVVTQGETKKKARDNLSEALSLFLITCLEKGTLDAVLKSCGFRVAPKIPLKKKTITSKEDYLNIPIPLLVDSATQKQCHV